MEKFSKDNGFLETKWTKEQVEGHILFGLYNRTNKHFWIWVLFLLYFLTFFVIYQSSIEKTGLNLYFKFFRYHLISLAFIIYFAYISDFSQSVIFWLSTKIALAIMAVLFCLFGFIDMLKGYSNWYVGIIVSLVWFPFFEFLPNMSKYQKILDLLRLLLTVLLYRMFLCEK